VRDYNTLDHLRKALELTHTGKRDLVVMTVQVMKGPDTGYENIGEQHLFTNYEQLLFSKVIALAEKAGKHVDLLVVPSSNVFEAIAHTAAQLDCSEIIAGRSSVLSPQEQAKRLGEAWEALQQKPKHQVCFRVVEPDGATHDFYLGAHAPHLADDDITAIHKLWLDITHEKGGEDAHHKEIVTVALARLEEAVRGDERRSVVDQIRKLMHQRSQAERAQETVNSKQQTANSRQQTANSKQ
jgi:hypothetical protein